MASNRSPVAMIKNAGECAALRARIAKLERILRGLQAKVERVARVPKADENLAVSSRVCRAPGAARARPMSKSGWTIESLPRGPSANEGAVAIRKPEVWRVVSRRSGGKVTLKRGSGDALASPVPVSNRYQLLSEGNSEVSVPTPSPRPAPRKSRQSGKGGMLVIGSSNVRRVMVPLRERAGREGVSQDVTSWCIPSGGVPQVTQAVGAAVRGTKCSRLQVVAHVGVNDAMDRGSEEILRSFRELDSEVKRVSGEVGVDLALTICSLVPRIDRGPLVWSRVEGINQRLRRFCTDIGASFVDLRPAIRSCRRPLNRSGVHYTDEAASRVASSIFEHCRPFLGQRVGQ
jgi:hypothetical protein